MVVKEETELPFLESPQKDLIECVLNEGETII